MSLHGGLFADPAGSSSGVEIPDLEEDSDSSSSRSTSVSGIVGGLISDPVGPKQEDPVVVDEPEPEPEPDDDRTDTSSTADARRQFRQAEQEADTDQPDRSMSNGDVSDGVGGFLKRAMDEAGSTVDDAGQAIADATGATEFAESEAAAELREARDEAREEGGVMGALGAFDASTRAGFDFLLDNPRVSVQDTTREGVAAATGLESDQQGEAAAALGQRFNEIVGGAQQEAGEALEGTALDNPVTDTTVAAGEFLAEAIVADPSKALLRGATGIDVDEGDEEGTVGAIDAFDIGVTVGTAGAGKAGLSLARGAVRGSDEAGGVLARLLGRGSDDAARMADEAGEAAQSGDELLPVLADDAARAGDDLLPRVADDTAQVADEAGTGVRDALFGSVAAGAARSADEAAGLSGRIGRFVDELTGRAARGADEGAQLSDEGARLTDDAARLADEGAQVGDEGISILQRITGSSVVRIGGAVTGGTLAGGALLDALGTFDQLSVTDDDGNEWLLIREKDYPPTQEHRDGGVLWRVEREGQAGSQGYTVMVGADGRNVYILDGAGNRMRAKVDPQTFREAVQRARGAA